MNRLVFPVVTILASAAASLGVMATTASSDPVVTNQPICGQRDEIVKSLSEQFKERPQAVGVVDKNAVMEIFVSDAGSWTIIATGTDGNSCLVSSGEGWQSNNMIVGVDA